VTGNPGARPAALYLTLALTVLNFVGSIAARVVLTLYALELGAPAYAVGVIGGLLFLFPLLLSWPIGALADRVSARRLLAFAGVCGAGSLVLPYFFRALPVFYLAAALNGLALAFFHVTLQNLVGTLSRPEERARNFSNFSLAGSFTNFAGPLLGGLSIDAFGHAYACLAIALPPVAGLVLLAALGGRLPPGNPDAPGTPAPLKTLADRGLWRMLAVSGLVQLGTDLYTFLLPVYGHAIGLSATAIGAVLATFAVAAFIVRLFLARLVQEVPGERLLARAFYAGAAGFALVPLFTDPYQLAAVSFLFGLGMGLGVPLTVILMFSRSAAGRTGQTLGLRLTAANFVRLAGPIVFGSLSSAIGLPPAFWISAVTMVIGGLVSRSGVGGRK